MGESNNGQKEDELVDLASGGIIAYCLKKAGNVSIRLIKWLLRKNPRFAVVGYRKTGKTNLLRRMQGLSPLLDYRPTSGAPRVPDFEWHGVGKKYRIKRLRDYGGETSFWRFWEEGFVRDRPLGIVFMLDHQRQRRHLEALRFMVDFVSKRDRRLFIFRGRHSKARQALRVVLVLVNKSDKWRGKKTMDELLRPLAKEIERLQTLGIQVIQYSCSVTEGDNVFAALGEFFTRMIPKH